MGGPASTGLCDVLADTIQPFPTFSESFVAALAGLRTGVPAVA